MIRSDRHSPRLATQLAIVGTAMLVFMTLYEWIKQFISPDISIWESHAITILFTSLLSVVVSYIILKQFHRQYAKRLDEIAKRRASQEALKLSEEKWEGLVKNAIVGVYQVTPDGRILMANNHFAHMLGYRDSEDFLSHIQNISQIYAHPEERPAIIERLQSRGFLDGTEVELKKRGNQSVWAHLCVKLCRLTEDANFYEGFVIDITARKHAEAEKERLLKELGESLSQVKQLSGLLPICANCKKIRDDQGYWNQIEKYIQTHSAATFSHSCCPECAVKLYQNLNLNK
jgi:PAS domain S-box-containing protein